MGQGMGQGDTEDGAVVCRDNNTRISVPTAPTTAPTTATASATGPSTTSTTARDSNSNSKSNSDPSALLNDWVWNLSVRVCDVLTRIESGVSRRSGDMWRVGNVIASTCVTAKDLGSSSRPSRSQKDFCMEEKETIVSSLESDAQEGASSFLCRYLEALSGRDATCDVSVGRNVGQKVLKDMKSVRATVRDNIEVEVDGVGKEDGDEDGDGNGDKCGDVVEDLKSQVVWEEKFFNVPLPVTVFPTLSSPYTAAGGQCPGVLEEGRGCNDEEDTSSGGCVMDPETIEGGRDDQSEGSDGRGEVVDMIIPCEFQGSTIVADCTSSLLQEEETSSEIRALKRDVLSLSRDPRLLHVRDQIANPVLRALSSHGQHGQHGHGFDQRGRQAGSTWALKPIKGPQAKSSSLNGKVSWKNRPVSVGNGNPDCEMNPGLSIPEITSLTGKGAVCAMQSGSILDIGSVELLAVLIARILHGLPSKLLTATAWKDQTACWGLYRNYSFESLLKACRRIIS